MNAPELRSLIIGPTSGDHLCFEVVEIVSDELQGAGDFRVSVSVHCCGFEALAHDYWILRPVFDAFLAELRGFEASRVGSATLEAMSPGAFTLILSSVSPTQWPVVSGELTGPYHQLVDAYRGHLAFVFTLDAGFVAQLLHDFEHLLPSQAEPPDGNHGPRPGFLL